MAVAYDTDGWPSEAITFDAPEEYDVWETMGYMAPRRYNPTRCTARHALGQATAMRLGERLRCFEITCRPRGGCHREPLAADPGRWTWCADCLTVYDDYGAPVNPIPEFARAH